MEAMMEAMGGEEGMKDMIESMGGEEAMKNMGGPDLKNMNMEDFSPEDVKAQVKQMKELIKSGKITKMEIEAIRKEFSSQFGADINQVFDMAKNDRENVAKDVGEDGLELLDLLKDVLDKY